jgi:hypothetical protein
VENATVADGTRTSGGDDFIAASLEVFSTRKTAGGSGAALDLDKDLASSSEARRHACVYGVKTVPGASSRHATAGRDAITPRHIPRMNHRETLYLLHPKVQLLVATTHFTQKRKFFILAIKLISQSQSNPFQDRSRSALELEFYGKYSDHGRPRNGSQLFGCTA